MLRRNPFTTRSTCQVRKLGLEFAITYHSYLGFVHIYCWLMVRVRYIYWWAILCKIYHMLIYGTYRVSNTNHMLDVLHTDKILTMACRWCGPVKVKLTHNCSLSLHHTVTVNTFIDGALEGYSPVILNSSILYYRWWSTVYVYKLIVYLL